MKLPDLEKKDLEIISLKLANINMQAKFLTQEAQRLEAESNLIVQKFCDENKLDIKKTQIDILSGEVKLIEEK